MIIDKTIIAPATLTGKPTAINLVRLVGPEAFSILQKMINKDVSDLKPRYNYHLSLYSDRKNKVLLDDAMVAIYTAESSYCGADTVEFAIHGSMIILSNLLNFAVKEGASLAKPGEFSILAVLNGKMSLDKAKKINAMIHAPTKRGVDKVLSSFAKSNMPELDAVSADIEYVAAFLTAALDYPEEFDEVDEELLLRLGSTLQRIDKLLAGTKANRYLFEGVRVVIIGEPNVGKSSLLNAFIDEDKAIVTEIAGTTRDVVEGYKEIDGVLFHLYDTAGIRETADPIEILGIKKSIKALKEADIILSLSEGKSFLEDENREVKELIDNKPIIRVYTKSDMKEYHESKDAVLVSALSGDFSALLKRIFAVLDLDSLESDGLYSSSDLEILKNAYKRLKSVKAGLASKTPYDLLFEEVYEARNAIDSLRNVRSLSDDLYETVFKNFCIGK